MYKKNGGGTRFCLNEASNESSSVRNIIASTKKIQIVGIQALRNTPYIFNLLITKYEIFLVPTI